MTTNELTIYRGILQDPFNKKTWIQSKTNRRSGSNHYRNKRETTNGQTDTDSPDGQLESNV